MCLTFIHIGRYGMKARRHLIYFQNDITQQGGLADGDMTTSPPGRPYAGITRQCLFLVYCFVFAPPARAVTAILLLNIGIGHDTVGAGVVGTAIRNSTRCTGRQNECCSGLQYQPRQCRPCKWSISVLPRSQFTKSKGNLRLRRLVPLFVPIGVCVTTHDDGTASDVTIGMWRHNQQVTNHDRNGKPWFSLPK